MTETTNTETTAEAPKGWQGETLPIEVQAMILMRQYRQALAMIARTTYDLHKSLEARFEQAGDMEALTSILDSDPLFIDLLGKLSNNEEKFGDSLFRGTCDEAYLEGIDEFKDWVTYMAVGLWIEGGATIPDGLLDEFR